MKDALATKTRSIHYWTGRGTLCSLDNNVRQQVNHVGDWNQVTCKFCLYQRSLNDKKPTGEAHD